MNDVLLVKVGSWLWGLLPAAIGSGISLLFRKEESQTSGKATFFIYIAGVGVGHFFGHGTVEYFAIDHESYAATCIVITWGLFGLAIFSEVSNRLPGAIRAIFDQVPEVIRAAWKKVLGEK